MSKSFDRLNLLNTFVRIADAGSISAAARDLGLSQPSASRQLVELETRLKTQLVRRTTHALTLTESGQALLVDARQMLDSWESLMERHGSAAQKIQGNLKVVAPVALGQLHLARIATAFQHKYPEVNLTWQLRDEQIRFAEEGCDCWVKIGKVDDDNLIVRPLGKAERIVVGSPALLPETKSLDALNGIPLVAMQPFEGGTLPLTDRKSKIHKVHPPVRMTSNNIFACKEAVLGGLGMAILPRWFISRELREGTLVNLAEEYQAPTLTLHLAYLPSRHQPLRLRAFIESLQEGIGSIEGLLPIKSAV